MSTQKILNTGNQILTERPENKVESNWFDLSHDVKLSANFGELIPIACIECLPGDKFEISTQALTRVAPLVAPMMQRSDQRSEWFFVPYRIIWDQWEEFIAPKNAGDVPPALPYFANVYNNQGTIGDYLGLPTVPTGATNPIDKISALMHGAWVKIMWNWYEDENFNPNIKDDFFTCVTGDNTANWSGYNVIYKRNWDRDYFTSSLPWAQKGASVVIPINNGNIVPVSLTNGALNGGFYINNGSIANAATQAVNVVYPGGVSGGLVKDASARGISYDPNGSLGITAANMLSSSGTIQDLRTASAVQRWLEADARGGTRYIEIVKQHFNVNSSDARMNRAEYIGNTKQPIVISEVLQTSQTSTTPQGTMAGHGVTAGKGDKMEHYCEEWGVIIGVSSVIPATAYFQGIPKMYSKFDRLDYGWPELANIGEQPVQNRELFYDTTVLNAPYNNQNFGYLPRYGEYRLATNRVSGEFRTSLNYWHMAREWTAAAKPTLSRFFIQSDPTYRVFAITSDTVDHLYEHWYHNIKVNRKLPKYVIPELK